MNHILPKTVVGVLLLLPALALADAPPDLEACNVVWDSPSRDQLGSMPLGNGDLSANVWVEPSGDIVLLLGKTDSFGETGRLFKIGRLRVRFTPALPAAPFQQTLSLRSGQVVVKAGEGERSATVRLWVDANHPAVRVECDSAVPRSCRVKVELWRTREVPYSDHGEHSEYGLPQAGKTLVELADTVVPAPAGAKDVAWYHRNTRSIYALVMKMQHLESLVEACPDPLMNRTFGAVLTGTGMAADAAGELVSASPERRRVVSATVLTEQTPTAQAWLAHARELAAKTASADAAGARADHEAWWGQFWDRSWIFVRDNRAQGGKSAEAAAVTRGYALHRYMLASCSRGPLPPKFNGATFTVDPPGASPDFRRWGSNYWFQNTRWQDWPLLAAGDYEMLQPMFSMYLNALPLARQRTRLYYGHEGAFFPETMYFFGVSNGCDFGWNNPGNEPLNGYVRWYWQGGIELTAMMLDAYDHTGDETFARRTLLPLAEPVMTFFDRHWKRTPGGKIRFEPAQSLETWHNAANPMPEIAGLRCVLPRLLALPASLTTPAQRAAWARTLADLPDVPTMQAGPKTVLAPAETFGGASNAENCELYAVFPYRLFGVGKERLEMARDTFAVRRNRANGCWRQDGVHAAFLGLPEQARTSVAAHFSTSSAPQRFPGFWDAGCDWVPDMDNGGTAMTALQYMLLQSDGGKIRLLPAWPAYWDADFKLHAPGRTTVQAAVRGGRVVRLDITPASRRKDIVGVPGPAGDTTGH